jgi:hypothetical protein
MSIDIFAEAKEKTMPTWMKFVNAGDKVQGTYIGKITGQIDGYGNEQIIYQLLQEDGSVMNVGFGLNKKFLNRDMETVRFGQVIGFIYKGTIEIKDKFGKVTKVKDYGIHQDPKIVNAEWLKENEGNMPVVTKAEPATKSTAEDDFGDFNQKPTDDVPFSTPGSLTNEDKLAVIEKLAKDKLGATDANSAKVLVMEKIGIAVIPVQFDKIIEALTKL